MIPKEHQILCKGCGKLLDMRDVSIICHGWIKDGKIVCYDDSEISYSSSKKVDENVQYTKDKKSINLN